MRIEQEIFEELAMLCTSTGYVHAIAFLAYRDNMVGYAREITVKDMQKMFSMGRLIRTELSTLIGLLVTKDIDFAMPAPAVLQHYIDRTEALLKEMHDAMSEGMLAGFDLSRIADSEFNPFTKGQALREPIFYSGESAYNSQYLDLSPRKYAADNDWLISRKGFSIKAASTVVHAIGRFQNKKVVDVKEAMRRLPPDEWTILPGFSFTAEEISEVSGIDRGVVEKVLSAFAFPTGAKNHAFRALHDFNAVNATPLLCKDRQTYILLSQYSLGEALYEAPFYWMTSDKNYVDVAMQHRGLFTEEFSRERLKVVFGKDRVHSNINIYESKGEISGEIDVLVIFGDRGIVLQAKSKRLTLEARRGNDGQIQDDFKKSVQDSYAQGFKCAQLLKDPRIKLIDANSKEVPLPWRLKEIYIFCVVSDHYPALSFQAEQFLKFDTTDEIKPPFVMDVFTLDVMTEMLESPLQFLSYVNKRTGYSHRLMAGHELTILSYHLTNNLWLDSGENIMLSNDISADLDVAMAVRRDNVPGKRTPDGILTRFAGTAIGRIIKEIEARSDPRTIDLGFFLLTLSGDTIVQLNKGIYKITSETRRDGKSHDFTIGVGPISTGLTFHCNGEPRSEAALRLQSHCEMRKQIEKANTWFGICLGPDASLRFGLNLDSKWEPNSELDRIARRLLTLSGPANPVGSVKVKGKAGRNDPCPCGSGLKYKKCCLK